MFNEQDYADFNEADYYYDDGQFRYNTGYGFVTFDYENDDQYGYENCNQGDFDEQEWADLKEANRELQGLVAEFNLEKVDQSPRMVDGWDVFFAAVDVAKVLFGPFPEAELTQACNLIQKTIWRSILSRPDAAKLALDNFRSHFPEIKPDPPAESD